MSAQQTESLAEKIARIGSPVKMLRDWPHSPFKMQYPPVHSNWQTEQQGVYETAVIFDQSHHMTDVYFKGPDTTRLLSESGTNSFETYGRNRAKQLTVCNDDGYLIGTAVLFGLGDNEANLVGPAGAANWLHYRAVTGGYDVEVTRDERTHDNTGQRLVYRYEIAGPNAMQILEKVARRSFDDVGFFRMTDFAIGGMQIRGLVHTVIGLPGKESRGMEMFGPANEGPAVLDALMSAGEEFGIVRAGGIAYYTDSMLTGYPAQPTPAIYSGAKTQAYRDWLPGDWYEGKLSVGGSFASDSVDDYYVTPYDFGYGHLVKFDHDFVGREALEEIADEPHRKKVWLMWDRDDVTRVWASSLFDDPESRAKYLDTPLGRYARVQCDVVLSGDRPIGISTMCAYTANVRSWFSVAFVDDADVKDGAQVSLLWGEEGGGTRKRNVERHAQTTIRATMRTERPAVV